MIVKFYGVYFVDLTTGESGLCEVDGGICYEAYRKEEIAQDRAASNNKSAQWHADHYNRALNSRYEVRVIPDGVRVWDDKDQCEYVTGADSLRALPSIIVVITNAGVRLTGDVSTVTAENGNTLSGEFLKQDGLNRRVTPRHYVIPSDIIKSIEYRR